MSTASRPIRKPPAKRAFRGLVGRPPDGPVPVPQTAVTAVPEKELELIPPANRDLPSDIPHPNAPVKSDTAVRAARWRKKQKEKNPQFAQEEAARKREKRAKIKHQKEMHKRKIEPRKARPGFPLPYQDLASLRRQEDKSGLFVKGALHGQGKIIFLGGSAEVDKEIGKRETHPFSKGAPQRAQLSDEELLAKLQSLGDLQSKIDSIRDCMRRDKEFCAQLDSLSLDAWTELIKKCSEDLEYLRDLLYEKTEHQISPQGKDNGHKPLPDKDRRKPICP